MTICIYFFAWKLEDFHVQNFKLIINFSAPLLQVHQILTIFRMGLFRVAYGWGGGGGGGKPPL